MFINKKDISKPWKNHKGKNAPFIAIPSPLYYAPLPEEIQKINKFYHEEFINKNDIEYKKQWNCCKFAESYKIMANLYFNKFMNKDAYSLAVGSVYMLRKKDKNAYIPHVMNIIFYQDYDRGLKYNFFEIGNIAENITKKEFNSIELIIF